MLFLRILLLFILLITCFIKIDTHPVFSNLFCMKVFHNNVIMP